ncbi:hypothetical protein [Petrotoga sp. DB-2]
MKKHPESGGMTTSLSTTARNNATSLTKRKVVSNSKCSLKLATAFN